MLYYKKIGLSFLNHGQVAPLFYGRSAHKIRGRLMKASIINKRGVAIVLFEGQLNFLHSRKLQEQLKEFYATKKNKKIVFDLKNLEFIGSSGIRPFIRIFKSLNKKRVKPRLCGLSPEYQRLFRAFEGRKRFFIFSDEKEAIKSYRWHKKSASA